MTPVPILLPLSVSADTTKDHVSNPPPFICLCWHHHRPRVRPSSLYLSLLTPPQTTCPTLLPLWLLCLVEKVQTMDYINFYGTISGIYHERRRKSESKKNMDVGLWPKPLPLVELNPSKCFYPWAVLGLWTRPLKPPVYSIPIASQSFAFITGTYSEKLSLICVPKYFLVIANIVHFFHVSYFFNAFIFNGNLFVLLYKQYTSSIREKTDNYAICEIIKQFVLWPTISCIVTLHSAIFSNRQTNWSGSRAGYWAYRQRQLGPLLWTPVR